jgi:Protein of unknown function (DUF982)
MTIERSGARIGRSRGTAARSSESAWVAVERARISTGQGSVFDAPVNVAVGQVLVRTIRTPRDALDCLLDGQWPDKSGIAYELAISDCLRALAGEDSAAARSSFEEAARRAHVIVADAAHH